MYECQSYAILITLQIELSVFINVLQHTTEFQQTKTEYKKKEGAIESIVPSYISLKVVLPGFEPRQTEPKPVVLPLHHRTIL